MKKVTDTAVAKPALPTGRFAVIRIAGKQYRVSEGEEILVDLLSDLKKVEPEVLLVADGDPTSPDGLRGAGKVQIGKPVLKDVKVKVKVVTEMEKADKVRVYKYKAKSRYRKLRGFRAQHTRLLIEKI
jgi:large subunit ribosomal protein L21